MDLQLKDKRAFVSGSTQGIGFAIAKKLLQEGTRVIINGRTEHRVNEALQQLRTEVTGADVTGIAADFANADDVNNIVNALNDVDILINNVGIFGLDDFFSLHDETWYRYFEINLMSGMRLSRKLLPKMIEKKQGRIIFISSESGVNVPENMIHYGMTKAAMSALANGLSKLTKGTKVTVNTILGGPTYSDGVADTITEIANAQKIDIETMKSAIIEQSNPHILLQRFIKPEEIANLAVYLSSPLSVATNGANLRADSGVLKV
jgi:NAD(P)-dependent dehydrogenase (short-subunit alcohol dehydrogenase family)